MTVFGGADSIVVRRLCGKREREVRESESCKAGQRVRGVCRVWRAAMEELVCGGTLATIDTVLPAPEEGVAATHSCSCCSSSAPMFDRFFLPSPENSSAS